MRPCSPPKHQAAHHSSPVHRDAHSAHAAPIVDAHISLAFLARRRHLSTYEPRIVKASQCAMMLSLTRGEGDEVNRGAGAGRYAGADTAVGDLI